MDLSKIFPAISGKPGLYKMLAQTKNGLVVESLTDGKKFTAFSHERISTLEEISVYTVDEDIPLKEVLKAIYDKQNGEAAISHKASANELKTFFEEAVPNYDKETVYVSDMKKVISWYNTLHQHNILEFTEEEEKKDEESEATEDKAQPEKTETDTKETKE
ncbi:MAG: DUF5606 domain-containing protein [Bacteroidales bacterium]